MFLALFVEPSIRRSFFRLSAIVFILAGIFANNKLIETTEAATTTAPAPAEAPAPPPPQPGGLKNYNFDCDGSGRADIGRWHPANTEFKIYDNTGNFRIYTLGSSSAKAAPGNFNGDCYTDAGVFQNGTWTYKTSPGATAQTILLGTAGDIPAAGDYDGDGTTDAAVFRPSTGDWWVKKSSNGATISYNFGTNGDIPIPGDYDADGKADYAVYRNGDWYVQRSLAGYLSFNWGSAIDIPLQGDFDGLGRSDFAVYRPTDGSWYIMSADNGAFQYGMWGNYADQPVPADYDGDSKADIAVWRPTTGEWFIVRSSNPSIVDTYQLGVPGDTAVESAYTKQIGGAVSGYDMANARLAPKNATGGTDYYSQNFGWGTSLFGLPGRSGLDAGLGISYNSSTWIKVGSSMYFNPDTSNITPGFRFGPPVIEPVYYDSAKKSWSYIMVTPNGGRVQFRQNKKVGDAYFTADSSYTKLTTKGAANPNDPVEEISITVTTTDGTKMSFEWILGAYRCTKVTDRNGNHITNTFNANGQLTAVTDTLGRVISVGYDSNGTVSSITQTWKNNNGASGDTPHTWASFSYTTKPVAVSFSIPFVGPPNGTNVRVLDRINYADGSYTKFLYNGYIQVTEIKNYAADNSVLNSTQPSYSGPTTDVPKLGSTTTNITGASSVTVTNTAPTPGNYYLQNGTITGAGSAVEVFVNNHPNSLISKIWFGSSGWQEGLTIATEDCIFNCGSGNQKRWTWNNWTQDSPAAAYIINPYMTETQVGDGVNTKKTSIGYSNYTASTGDGYRLPTTVSVFANPADITPIKTSSTAYNTSPNYTAKWILTLPSSVSTSGKNDVTGNVEAATSVSYSYDDYGYAGAGQTANAVSHDNYNYGASYTYRGNLTTITRNDVTGASSPVTSTVKYNTTGSPISQTDPLNRIVNISYTDSWNDGVSRTTYAYPTTITDPANFSSSIQYRYDMGANVSATSPGPNGNGTGKSTSRIYEAAGRLERETINNTGAYTRYEYPQNGVQFKTFSTITDGAGEAISESWTDGAGRTYRSRSEHPGSVGGWSAVTTSYDILGRVIQQSVPTEVNSNWDLPFGGDDPTWKNTSKTYDWKGRVLNSTNTDGSNTTFAYEGCGCSGGQATTIEGELVPIPNGGGNARRKQKIYKDPLGRSFKTETFEWNGSTVYTTVINKFNGRDQVLRTEQYAGGTGGVHQDVVMTYDGHGRMASRHYPIEDTNASTSWGYNADDSVATVTDPRGSVTSYNYGNPNATEKRGVVTNIGYTPSSGVADSPDVAFAYNGSGSRTSMTTSGVSVTSYSYNSIGQLTGETLNVDDSGIPDYGISYSYHIGGGLKSVTDPFNKTINYTNDKVGRLTGLAGTPFGDNTTGNYADSIQYRAFGQVKSMVYKTTDNATVSMEYDNRLRVSRHKIASSQYSGGYMKDANFYYYADSRPKEMDNHIDSVFDRKFEYDFAGRLSHSEFGTYTPQQGDPMNPHLQNIAYDGFSNITLRDTEQWGSSSDFGRTYEQTTGRLIFPGGTGTLTYDASGSITYAGSTANQFQDTDYDAAGRRTNHVERWTTTGNYTPIISETLTTQAFDGDGLMVKNTSRMDRISSPASTGTPVISYFINSSVLGGTLTEVEFTSGTETRRKTSLWAGGTTIAEQRKIGGTDVIIYLHADPVTGSKKEVSQSGQQAIYIGSNREYEPLGQSVKTTPPFQEEPPPNPPPILDDAKSPEWQCTLSSMMHPNGDPAPPRHCSMAAEQANIWHEYEYTPPKKAGVVLAININKMKIPGGDGPSSPSGRALAYAASSAKKMAWNEGDDPSKKPYDGGNVGWVTVRAGDDREGVRLDSSFVDASTADGKSARIIYLGDEEKTVKRIRDIIDFAKGKKDCEDAFKAVGATSINDQLQNLTIVTQKIFSESFYDKIWNQGSDVGKTMRSAFKANPNTGDLAWPGLYGNTGHRFIGITNSAVQEKVDWLSVTVIHAFVHSGGKEGKDSQTWGDWLNGVTPHDLKYLGEKYKDVLKHCTKEKGSKALYGQ